MRQGQQNRRGRGRGRKPQNPLARNYESNGPDVKIRGTAAHIAEKYMSLARDALASGDMVTAESYLQHAEHYNRIIMAAQSQMGPQHGGHQGEGPNGGYRQPRWNEGGDEGDDEGAEAGGSEMRGGEMRQGGDFHRQGGDFRQGGGGRDDRRHGGNGREGARDQNGADQPEPNQPDDPSSDQPT
jgi:hypothetical protein